MNIAQTIAEMGALQSWRIAQSTVGGPQSTITNLQSATAAETTIAEAAASALQKTAPLINQRGIADAIFGGNKTNGGTYGCIP
ncbi:MAG TPA: hypothetical protein VHY20_05540 [Pirellulales bacterium]|nr:hypothetical protein [Pirellulales bacterium]